MNFLTKAAATVGNAVEINNLKTKREKLTKEKLELEVFCAQYDQQLALVESIRAVSAVNTDALAALRTVFVRANVNYDVEFHQFQATHAEHPELINCKKIYDRLMHTNKEIEQPVVELGLSVSVPRDVYVNKIASLQEEIDKVNEKLKVVRDKQHGKKN